jgi:hypothetical protein
VTALPERARPFEAQGEVTRRRWSLVAGAIVLYLASIALLALGAPRWGPAVEQLLALVLFIAFANNAYPLRQSGRLAAAATGLSLDGRTVVRRDQIATAFRTSDAEPFVRIVRRNGRSLDVKLADDGQVEALLDALGLGVGLSTATFRATLGGRRTFLAMVAAIVAAGALSGGLAGVVGYHDPILAPMFTFVVLVAMASLVSARVNAQVDVGSDGVLLRRRGGSRFLPYRVLESIAAERGSVVLRLATGERVLLRLHDAEGAARDALVARVEEALSAFRAGSGPESAEALVAPGGRPVDRWLREVRAIAKARDYREARLDADRLWRLLLDSTASPATRAGAAIAVSHDEAARARLRVAAEACVEPRLRVALDRVAQGAGDAELEEALTQLLEAEG